MNKIALIFPVLQSYEVLERQIKYMNSLPLPEDWEVVIVDDGSDPPIKIKTLPSFNYKLVRTYDYNKWTQAKAVNYGVEMSDPSEFMWGLAVDHFISKENIEDIKNFTGDKMVFPRLFATLDKDGKIRTDEETLMRYGWVKKEKQKGKGTGAGFGCFVMRRTCWDEIGGYDMARFAKGGYGGDDVDISHKYSYLCRVLKKAKPHEVGHLMYVYPSAAYDAMEIFHNLRGRRKVKWNYKDHI